MTAIESVGDAKSGLQAVGTSFYGIGGDNSAVHHTHLQWDAAFVGTFTFWSCDFPEVAFDAVSAANGGFVQENPPTGYTAISPAGAATAATPLVIAVPGGTAGGASVNLGNNGARRLGTRVVCTTQGIIRIRTHGKI